MDFHLSMDFPSTQKLPECDDSFISEDVNQKKTQVGTLEITSTEAKLHNMVIFVYPVYEGDNVIGRHDNCDISIPSGIALSKKHACIEADSTMSFVYDCGSSNKTKLKTLKLKPNIRYSLNDGDQLTLANIKFKYKTLSTELRDLATPQSKKHNTSFLEIAETPTSDLVDRQKACNKRSSNVKEIPDSQPELLIDSLTPYGNEDYSVADTLIDDDTNEAKLVCLFDSESLGSEDKPTDMDLSISFGNVDVYEEETDIEEDNTTQQVLNPPVKEYLGLTDAETQRYDKTSKEENDVDSDSTDIDSSNMEDSFTVVQTQHFSKPQIETTNHVCDLSDSFCMLETQQYKHKSKIAVLKNAQINDPIYEIETQAFINKGPEHETNKKLSHVVESDHSDLNSDEEYSILPSLQPQSFTQTNMSNENSKDLVKSGPSEINIKYRNDFQSESHLELHKSYNKNVSNQSSTAISIVHSAQTEPSFTELSRNLETSKYPFPPDKQVLAKTDSKFAFDKVTNLPKSLESVIGTEDTIPVVSNADHQNQIRSQGSADNTIPNGDIDDNSQPGDSLISEITLKKLFKNNEKAGCSITSGNSLPFSLSLKGSNCAMMSELPDSNNGKSYVENGVKTISPLKEKNCSLNVASVQEVSKILDDLNKNNVMQPSLINQQFCEVPTTSPSFPAVEQIEHRTMNRYEKSGCIDKCDNVQTKKMPSQGDDINTSGCANNEIENRTHIIYHQAKYLEGTLTPQTTNGNTACRLSDVKLSPKVADHITPHDDHSNHFIKEDCLDSDNIDTQIGDGGPSSINRHSDNLDDFVATQVFASSSPLKIHLPSESVKVAEERSITFGATGQSYPTDEDLPFKSRKTRRVRKCFEKDAELSTKSINENESVNKKNLKKVKTEDKSLPQTNKRVLHNRNDEGTPKNNKMMEDEDISKNVGDSEKKLNEKRITIRNTIKIEPMTPTNDIKRHTSRKRRKVKDDTIVQETPTISSSAKKFKHEGDEEDTAYSAALSLRPRRQKPKVVFTGVVDKDGESTVCKLGGIITDDMLQCTHLVTDTIRRTVKFMCAMVRGIYIVDRRWLLESKMQSRFLPEENFQLAFSKPEQKMDSGSPNADLERQYGFHLSSSLARANSRKLPLFSGLCIHVTKSVQPPPDQMYQIVECGGGEVLRRLPRSWSAERRKKLVVVSADRDKKCCATPLKNLIPVVSKEFILTGILRQKLDIDAFRLFAFTSESNNNVASSNLPPSPLKSKTRKKANCDVLNNMNTRTQRRSSRRK